MPVVFVKEFGADWVSLSSSTVLKYQDPNTNEIVSLPAQLLYRGEEMLESFFDRKYALRDFGKIPVVPVFYVYFAPLPEGVSSITIEEGTRRGFKWEGIQITPRQINTVPSIGENSIDRLNELISKTDNHHSGIYEELDDEYPYCLAFLKQDGNYYLVYIDNGDEKGTWTQGDIKAILRPTISSSVFKAEWYSYYKEKYTNCTVAFNNGIMDVTIDGDKYTYVKMLGENDDSHITETPNKEKWTGTGFALENGYICTNYHVIDGAESIKIIGIHGDFTESYTAKVVASDKWNDLAILKVDDSRFNGFDKISYKVKTTMAEVGEEVFVLGYPLTGTMGDEIKLTTGVISSRTGFQGDVSLYQISAPIQPGNSGGPLFDKQGNLIGIVSAKHTGAENVGYAIKASYLKNLMESAISEDILPTNNLISATSLTDQIKKVKNFVYLISCSNQK